MTLLEQELKVMCDAVRAVKRSSQPTQTTFDKNLLEAIEAIADVVDRLATSTLK